MFQGFETPGGVVVVSSQVGSGGIEWDEIVIMIVIRPRVRAEQTKGRRDGD